MIVLGVDVGIRNCGYVLCNVKNLQVDLIKEGQVKPDSWLPLPQKLSHIFTGLEKEIIDHKPEALVVEKLYSHYRHPVTLGVLAQVRGVVALLAYQEKIGFFEYSPTRARKSFLGRGNVNSEQVKKMAENVTGKKFKSFHTADAFSLVVAFSHAQKMKKIRTGIAL
jgi:crossover junction endodeoxyribonuclease RuvC